MLLGILTTCSWPLFTMPYPSACLILINCGRLFHTPIVCTAVSAQCSLIYRRPLSHAQVQFKERERERELGDGRNQCGSCVNGQMSQPPIPWWCISKACSLWFHRGSTGGLSPVSQLHPAHEHTSVVLLSLLSLLWNRLLAPGYRVCFQRNTI